MPKPTVYVETTIISYLTARRRSDSILEARQAMTREWWERRRSAFEIVTSEVVFREAQAGDPDAAARRMNCLSGIISLPISDEAVRLADALVEGGPIPRAVAENALHIALCAVNGIDFLVTWNCKHLANAFLRHRIEEVVESHGYKCPIICTPDELEE
jgi:predicted nucleic acid-binding protein